MDAITFTPGQGITVRRGGRSVSVQSSHLASEMSRFALELGDRAVAALRKAGFTDMTWTRKPSLGEELVSMDGESAKAESYPQAVARIGVRPGRGSIYEIDLATSWIGGDDYTASVRVSAECCGQFVEYLPVLFTAFGSAAKVPDPVELVVRLISRRPHYECSSCRSVALEEDGVPF